MSATASMCGALQKKSLQETDGLELQALEYGTTDKKALTNS
jgi:hypothetical protein